MTSDNIRQRVFRRMLAREARTGANATAIAAAARRLCEHNVPGKGCVFTIDVPLASETVPASPGIAG